MILSVSRRTDIPAFYSDWFINRIKEGYLCVKNPMNAHQISKIDISPEVTDCIVFWTKNAGPMLDKLDVLKDYQYYFQYTVTGYQKDIEKNVPGKMTEIVDSFQKLSQKIGKEKVIWRYDPILFNDKYTTEYHLKAFRQIAEKLSGYTEKCVISFVDEYVKNKKNLQRLHMKNLSETELKDFCKELVPIAEQYGFSVASCAEKVDLSDCGIQHNCCIDGELIERIIGVPLKVEKDKNQRIECGCVESIEVGTYNTCTHGCVYCYANYSPEAVARNVKHYKDQPDSEKSELLCAECRQEKGDKVNVRKVKSLKKENEQLSML